VKLLPKPLSKEMFTWYTNQSAEDLKSDIQYHLSKWTGANLEGKFFSDGNFTIKSRWQLAVLNSFERELAYLNGEILQHADNRTAIKCTVRPNSIFPILFFGFLLLGLCYLGNHILNDQSLSKVEIVRVIFLLIGSMLILVFSHVAKKSLSDRFAGTFNLKPVK
jgi:hypothetical protein